MSYRNLDPMPRSKPGRWERAAFGVATLIFLLALALDKSLRSELGIFGHILLWTGFALSFLRYRREKADFYAD